MLLQVGTVVRAHGLRGEVVVELLSNRSERLEAGSLLHSGPRLLKVIRASQLGSAGRGPHADRWLVAFEGVNDRASSEALRGVQLQAEPIEVPGALWVHEMVGRPVRDTTGALIGQVDSVEANPASDLLVLDSGDLIPLVFVVDSGVEAIVVDLPDGLLTLRD